MPKKYITKNMKIAELERLVKSHLKTISTLIERPKSREATIIKIEYSIHFGMEKTIWSGKLSEDIEFDGLLKKIQND